MNASPNGSLEELERQTLLEQFARGELPADGSPQEWVELLANPALRGTFIEALLTRPLDHIRTTVQRLAATGDARVVLVLAPLLHAADLPVVQTAIDALIALGDAAARPALEERVRYDRRREVRQAAQEALTRIPEGPATLVEDPVLPLEAAYLTVVDGAGGQMALIARRWPEGDVAVLHVIFDDVQGLREAFGFPAQPLDELTETLDDLEDDGLTPVELPLAEVRETLQEAYRRTLERRGRAPVEYVAWRAFLHGDDPRELPEVTLPRVRLPHDLQLLHEADQLLDLDEFGSWYFEPWTLRHVLDRLQRLQRYERGKRYERQVVALIRRTLNELLDPETRQRFRRRLERQAKLLARIYPDDPTIPARCLAAAAGLAEDAGVPVSEHPLFQRMLVRSLEEALGRPLVQSA